MRCHMFWQVCPECAKNHWFALPGDDCTVRSAAYEFTCPVTGDLGAVSPAAASEEVGFITPGAVIVTRVDSHEAASKSCPPIFEWSA